MSGGEGARATATGQDSFSTEDGHSQRNGRTVADTEGAGSHRQEQGRAGGREPREKTSREAGQVEGETGARRGRQRAQVTDGGSGSRCRRTHVSDR